jgi:hypothetical protein
VLARQLPLPAVIPAAILCATNGSEMELHAIFITKLISKNPKKRVHKTPSVAEAKKRMKLVQKKLF